MAIRVGYRFTPGAKPGTQPVPARREVLVFTGDDGVAANQALVAMVNTLLPLLDLSTMSREELGYNFIAAPAVFYES